MGLRFQTREEVLDLPPLKAKTVMFHLLHSSPGYGQSQADGPPAFAAAPVGQAFVMGTPARFEARPDAVSTLASRGVLCDMVAITIVGDGTGPGK